MIYSPTKCLGPLTLVLALTACTATSEPALMMMAQQNAQGIVPTTLIAQGKRSNVVLSNTGAMRQTMLDYLGGGPSAGNLGHVMQHVRSENLNTSNMNVPGMTGLGGIYGHAFLDLAERSLKGNGTFNPGKRVVVSLSGQLLDYSFNSDGSGMIEAVTYITRSVVSSGLGVPSSTVDAYRFKVVVDPGGFIVINHSGDDDDPFQDATIPSSFAFSPETLERIESLGFMFKLWAIGEKIRVTDVWITKGYTWGDPTDESANKIDPVNNLADQKYARLFETDADSCIDMMFVNAPPATFADLDGPPFHCLGRCADPLLINTH